MGELVPNAALELLYGAPPPPGPFREQQVVWSDSFTGSAELVAPCIVEQLMGFANSPRHTDGPSKSGSVTLREPGTFYELPGLAKGVLGLGQKKKRAIQRSQTFKEANRQV